MNKYLFVNSNSRSNGTNSNFTVDLGSTLNFDDKRAKFVDIQIPGSWYNIRTGVNNNILFNEGSGNLTAVLTPGQYNITTLAAEIKAKMEAVGTLTYTVSFSSITLKTTISATGNFELKFGTETSYIWHILGFENVDTANLSSHTSPNSFNMTGCQGFFIKSNTLSNQKQRPLYKQEISSYVLRIPIYQNPGDTIIYTPEDLVYMYNVGGKELDSYDFGLYYDEPSMPTEEVDLNGLPWSFTLVFF